MAKLVAALLLSLLPFSPAFSHDSDPTEDLLKAVRKAKRARLRAVRSA